MTMTKSQASTTLGSRSSVARVSMTPATVTTTTTEANIHSTPSATVPHLDSRRDAGAAARELGSTLLAGTDRRITLPG